jgi:TrmH family RNA methyltransferase
MKNELLDNITTNLRIVMVETTHPGNIGAAARAMKNMGQRNLYLVKPKIYPSAEVTARAAGADDILARAVVCNSLQEAIQDCSLIVATTARTRTIPWPVSTPRECATEIINATASGNVAVVFGRESSGLNNEELELCNTAMQIPTDPDFSSLNVASAIQIICYELLQTIISGEVQELNKIKSPPATSEQMQLFYEHLSECMTDIGYYDPEVPRSLMRRMKRLFNRARLDRDEMNILRGLLSSIQEAVGKKSK